MSTAATPAIVMIKLLGRQAVAENTMAFKFAKPAGFKFTAGQFLDITLLNPPETDAEGNTRGFSIASAPYEDDLMIATRMRDTAFKRVLKDLSIGTQVKLEAAYGKLCLHNNPERAAVFIAGGIGITPFRSIILEASKEKLPHRMFLFYSNKRPEDAVFLEELDSIQKENANFKFIPTMTEMEKSKSNWKGERGHIDGVMLSRHLKNIQSPIYYVAGPPGLVQGLQKMLKDIGINSDDIRAEEFTGY